MKIVYGSDIHVNHWLPFIKNQEKWEKRTKSWVDILCKRTPGDVLVLAGDFSEMNRQTIWLLEVASQHYERVYWTFGNHDLYLLSKKDKKRYDDSLGRILEVVEKTQHLVNVIPLIKNTDTYKGVTFAGDALWYYPKGTKDESFFLGISNDSVYIDVKNTFTPLEACKKLHVDSLKWYNELGEVDIMVTHVPPLHNSNSKYNPNTCYYNDAIREIKAKHWICGHEHQQTVFEKAGTTFYMNSIGYPDAYKEARINQMPYDFISFKDFSI